MDFLYPELSSLPSKVLLKPTVAVLAGPTRSFMGWANVKMSTFSRFAPRYVILRSSILTICATDNPRSQLLSVPVTGATMIIIVARNESLFRTSSHRITIQWASESDLRTCKAAFEFSNRQIHDYFKLVTHRQLGRGRNSEVVFAFDTATGDHAAVKVINKEKSLITHREFAENEVLIRMTVQHPNIVQTLDIFESPYDLFVVMELMVGGSLDRRMLKQGMPLTESEARVVMHRLFVALRHLHSRNIAHRNVKPQNIFLDVADDTRWPHTTKLSDFSLACFLDDPSSSNHIVGTPEFLAPEASFMTRSADGQRGVVFGTEVDLWAAGVTLYNLLSLQLPFEGELPPDVFKLSRLGNVTFGKAFDNISDEAIALIQSLMNVDRRKRLTADTVFLHPWFQCSTSFALSDFPFRKSTAFAETELSDGLKRFRAAAISIIMMVRLCKRTSLVDGRGRRCTTKQFEFNVSGINIAPLEGQYSVCSGTGNDHVDGGRNSLTAMSRVSTVSTVKSRSSMSADPTCGYAAKISARSGFRCQRPERSDNSVDYLSSRGERRQEMCNSFDRGPLIEIQRMMSDMSELVLITSDSDTLRNRQ